MKQVPKRRFGRTEVQMPVLSCGGMRYQQAWDDIDPDKIEAANQANVEACIQYAVDHGINHIETARGYGSSEMQLGLVLPKFERDKLLVQTKVGVKDSAAEFIKVFETSLAYLNLEYVDFVAIHGVNLPEHVDAVLKKGGCLDAIRQLQKEGRVRFGGFSTHGSPEVVNPLLETGELDYVNMHWYFIYDQLNRSMLDAAAKQDMGVFIISPTAKGGMYHNPTEKMAKLCEPLTPMKWHDLFCLSRPEVHTLSVGAARPSDFDAHIDAVTTHWGSKEVVRIEQEIQQSLQRDLGADWMKSWFEGIPLHTEIPNQINVREILRLWTFYKGLDLLEVAKARYNLLGNAEHWFPGRPALEIEGMDWSCLADSPFADRIPGILAEAHQLFYEAPKKRMSES